MARARASITRIVVPCEHHLYAIFGDPIEQNADMAMEPPAGKYDDEDAHTDGDVAC
jgi:hypothetical protein